jgi:hypothetical protein
MAVTGSMSIQVPREVLGGGVAVWYYVIIYVSIDYLCIYVPYIYDIYIFHQNGWLNDLGSETIEEHTHFFS